MTELTIIKLWMFNTDGIALQEYNLSPGCIISHQLQKDNILGALPELGQLVINMGLLSPGSNVVSVTGRMLYDHNTRKPLAVFEEIENIATYKDLTNSGAIVVDGLWMIEFCETTVENQSVSTSLIKYWGYPKMVNYQIESGHGNIVSYTIQLDVSDIDLSG
jgi:hypothetical protein